jgi:hypothetical protein
VESTSLPHERIFYQVEYRIPKVTMGWITWTEDRVSYPHPEGLKKALKIRDRLRATNGFEGYQFRILKTTIREEEII